MFFNENAIDRPRRGGIRSAFPSETPVGMAYVPFQAWETPFPENDALEMGTIFPSLYLPFEGRSVT